MPLFYKGIQASKANKAGVKTWHPSLVKMKKVINTHKHWRKRLLKRLL